MSCRAATQIAVLGLAACFAATSGVHAEDDQPILLRLVRPDAVGYEEARATWEALTAAEQVRRLREGLASSDRTTAEVAAAEIGGEYLSLEEIHRRSALLTDRFSAAVGSRQHDWGVGGIPPVGAPDVVPLWRALAERVDVPRKETLAELHRVTLPEHLPDLVPLLQRGGKCYFESLLWTVSLVADFDASDRFRDAVERGMEFGLKRLRLERGYDPAAVRALSIDNDRPAWPPGGGLPEGLKEIARAAWGLDQDGFRVAGSPGDEKLQGRPPLRWLHRQLSRFVPGESDGTFIADVVRGEDVPLEDRWWAMQHLLKLSPEWGGEIVARIAGGDGVAALVGAAALFLVGRPDAWAAIDEDERSSSPLAWAVDPRAARQRWLDAALRMVQEGIPVPDSNWAVDLRPLARARVQYEWGVRIAEDDLRWIAARLAEAKVPPLFRAAYIASVLPDDLTPTLAATLGGQLETMPAPDEDSRWLSYDGVEGTLAVLEVANPDALRSVLVTWATRFKEDDRLQVLVWLAKLGDTTHVPAMLATWAEWDLDQPVLGRVRDDRVEAFLKERLATSEAEESGHALAGLCIQRGVPSVIFDGVYIEVGAENPSWRVAVEHALAGDAVGAVLALRPTLAELGLIQDPRVETALRRAREDREEETYWTATAGLALSGDATARSELLALIREGRMWFFDGLLQSSQAVVLTCNGDPEFLGAWADLVESNCCLGWAAEEVVLRERFPTIPVASTIAGGFTPSAAVRAWLERHRNLIRYSGIRNAWLPRSPGD